MKLGQKLVLLMVLVMGTLLLTACIIAAFVMLDGFRQIEVERTEINLARIKNAIAAKQRRLESTVGDWANWDDTHHFANSGEPTYVENNLQPAAIRNIDIHVMAIVNQAGEVVWSGALDSSDEFGDAPAQLLDLLKPGGELAAALEGKAGVASLLEVDSGTLLVAVRPILPSNLKGPPAGLLAMGYFLDEAAATLGDALILDIQLLPAGLMAEDEDTRNVWAALAAGAEQFIQPTGFKTITGYTLFTDHLQRPILAARAEMPRDIYRQGIKSYILLVALLMAAGLVSTATLLRFQHKLVVSRLGNLRNQIGRIDPNDAAIPRIALHGNDELTELADRVDLMVRQEHTAIQKIAASNQQHEWLFSQMVAGFAIHEIIRDEAGSPVNYRFLSVNRAFEQMTGLQARALVGRTALEVLPDSVPIWIETFGRVAQTGEPVFFDAYWKAFDKHFEASAFRTGPGQFAVMFTDITARKKAEARVQELLDESNRSRAALLSMLEDVKRTQAALNESQADYRALFENMPSGYAHCRMQFEDGKPVDFEILRVNSATARITGLSGIEGKRVSEIIPDLIRTNPEIFEQLGRVAATGEPASLEAHVPALGIWFSIVAHSPCKGEFVTMFNDISERKEMEAKFLRTQRLESVGRLASGIAHDLNNILTPVMMAPPLLRESIRDPSALSLLDSIEKSAQRGSDIIKQLLLYGRGTGGKRNPVSLRTLLRDMVKFIEETFPKNIVIQAKIPQDLALVSGDATQLHQILVNLCVNARDAMPNGGTLSLEIQRVEVDAAIAATNPDARIGPHQKISVQDTGTGIDPDHMDKLFEPFFTTKAPGEGTGLGLPTTLAIVRSHEGFIHVESLQGKGSTFSIFLPAAGPSPGQIPEPAEQAPPQGRGELILVVDDEEHVRQVACRLLQRNGYRCECVSGGAQALESLSRTGDRHRALLTDLMMPGMDGAELIRRTRAQHPHLPIIAMTGFFSKSSRPEEIERTVALLIEKPFRANALLAGLRHVLDAG